MKKTIVQIASGGLDSTVLLYNIRNAGYNVHALTFDYGQRHLKEIGYARGICTHLAVPWKKADLSAITPLLAGSSQTDPTEDVPEGHFTHESMKKTVVPNRNMIMIAIAAGWAISLKADCVAYGAHAGDHTIYPDCRAKFTSKLAECLTLADWHSVELIVPFQHKSKSDIVRLGHDLNVPFNLTWSCYKGGKVHCGRCGTCVERREAFIEAAVTDPTEYEL